MLPKLYLQSLHYDLGGGTIRDVEKKEQGTIVLYALSTCIWCRKTKNLLNKLGVRYIIVDVDLLEGPERDCAEDEVRKYNPLVTFPTLVINSQRCIAGYQEEEIRKAFVK